MRTAFVNQLVAAAQVNERIWLLSGDLGFSVLEPFANAFPGRYVNVGVAEQNLVGVASGLALAGKIVFTYSIVNFTTFRCLEQIRNDACCHRLPVKIVAVGGGLVYGPHGYTHHGIEDLAVMRSLPALAVLAPGDPVEARLAVGALIDWDGPGYVRLGKAGETVIHREVPPAFVPGAPIEVRSGRDVAMLSTGGMLEAVLAAAETLDARGISTSVHSVPWIKPLDRRRVEALATSHRLLITVEEGQRSGGLGGAVSEVVVGMHAPHARVVRIGLDDLILREALSHEAARAANGLDHDGLVTAVLDAIR